ncbi:MAG: 1-(5-phosphoribosyl)-5-[(5-phosphoribosylamino)methylideneamino]imidazole-4-carboxamide isomerase [bacterium]|nr:1-(5-phosphoribosyl)-5-[(5-phosphoribosylamino)methylideneamino]imidazole-4-carboxamide isomerase [bacterium]
MEIIPAIDLRGGKCVRLQQGDAARCTEYSGDPVGVARGFRGAGALWVHVVDLDGAFEGKRRHMEVVRAIIRETGLQVELGGGIRTLADIRECVEAGVKRVVLGTAAYRDTELVVAAVKEYGGMVAVGIDARGGRVAVGGWLEDTGTPVLAFAERMAATGVRTLIYTDIAVDGMLAGPDYTTLSALCALGDVGIIASGGIGRLDHVRALKALKPRAPDGCIIGRALYTGAVDLGAAIAVTRE